MQNSVIQAAVRYLTGNAGQFNEDLHALADMLGVSPGTAEARLAAVLSLPPANVYAALGECGDGVFEGMVAGAVLKKYGASLILPGADGATVSSFHTGNFTESTGQTYAAIDGLVGLGLDAAGSLGPELVTNGDFSNGLTGWTSSPIGTGTATVVNGQAVLQFNTSANRGRIIQQETTVSGRIYEVRITVVSGTPNLNIGTTSAGADTFTANNLAAGSYRYLVSSGAAFWLTILPNTASTVDSVIDNISVRELPGTHASQATQGYKPYLRRGIVNLLTYSNDFSNAAWGKTNVTASANLITLSVGALQKSVGNNVSGLTQATLAFLLNSGTVPNVQLLNGGDAACYANFSSSDGTPGTAGAKTTASSAVLPDGKVLVVASFASASLNSTYRLYAQHSNSASFGAATTAEGSMPVYGAALFKGTVTAQQILDAGGIPLTTNAAASSANGKFWWQFDGIDDKLTMTFPAGWESATIIDARATGQVTQSGQNIVGTYNVQTSTYGRIFCRLAPSASDLALLQKFANILAGV